MEEENIKRIAVLIGRELTGQLTEYEHGMLDEWRRQSDKNEQLYQRLTDKERLAREYRLMKSVGIERPLADMKGRIARLAVRPERTKYIFRLWAGVAAIALLILVWKVNGWIHHSASVEEEELLQAVEIRPGQTQATLILSTGENLTLDSDTLITSQKKALSSVQAQAVSASTVGEVEKVKANILITPRGGEFKIVLEDGTEVWLNAESRLTYPETFGSEERRVSVQGEAYFKVHKDAEKPFYIETDGQLIRVYGTEFNVRSYEEDEAVCTTLVEGSISIRPVGTGQGELILAPNHQSLFNKKDATASLRTVNPEVFVSWKNGMFVFEEQNLEQIMCTLSRWYNFTYTFKDESLKATVFMGSIPRYAEFDDVIRILEKSGGIKLEMKGPNIILSKR
ncbi:FecR family protein [Bacteroides sp. AN502(2024)]|uniref:FecR family protein n=1 Tax=Bacteroides sp. AN502(2024) TaxID=3160599 RepID=UPI0035158EE2